METGTTKTSITHTSHAKLHNNTGTHHTPNTTTINYITILCTKKTDTCDVSYSWMSSGVFDSSIRAFFEGDVSSVNGGSRLIVVFNWMGFSLRTSGPEKRIMCANCELVECSNQITSDSYKEKAGMNKWTRKRGSELWVSACLVLLCVLAAAVLLTRAAYSCAACIIAAPLDLPLKQY